MKIKTIKLGKLKISYQNFQEFILLFLGVYIFNGYKFKTTKKTPLIIDCGSHIGISVLGFKKRYPNSRIIAFEPNRDTFKILAKNVKQNSLKNVKLINAALGSKKGKIDFYVNTNDSWSWGNSVYKSWFIKKDGNGFKKIKVKSVILSKYLNKEVDLLKINIEGAETLVLKEISGKLKNVKEIYLHFHGERINKSNDLNEIFKILDANYYYTIRQLTSYGIPKKVTKRTINKREPYFLLIHARKEDF